MSRYIFEGKLHAYICKDCWIDVSDAQIRLYRHREDQDVDRLVAARSKHTFEVLSDEAVEAKEDFLIAETQTRDDGSFRFELADQQHYDGGPFEIDVRLESIPGTDAAKKREPIQFTITSVKPEWKEGDGGALKALWEHYISARFWCELLGLWDLWVICGRIVATGTQTGLDGMAVRAYDRDWLQDDLLGQDTTDPTGRFLIYYTSATFKKTPFPFLNIELTSGPDLYFQVEDSGGTLVIDENPSEGRLPTRENVGRCFCVTLEVGEEAPPYNDPWFTHVGNFHILWDIDSTTGKARWAVNNAGGTDWGFHGHTKLKGFCPKTHPTTSQPMFYRFLYVDPITSTEKEITGDLLTKVQVGSKLVWWDPDNNGVFAWTTQSIHVAGSGATPPVSGGTGPVPDHIVEPDGQGWIAVDQDALDNGFYGPLLRLNTNKIVPGGGAPGSGAGNPPTDPKSGALVTVIFETTTDMVSINRQVFTVTLLVNNWSEVRQLDLQEFIDGALAACTGLTSTLTIKYTVNHQLVDSWALSMSSAASPWMAPPLSSGNSSSAGTEPVINVSTWPPCSYSVHLASRRALTDGETNDSSNTSTRTFCKT